MTNIFNKKILVKNGTLIGNWYEEEILREKTGEGRTIPSKHIQKKHMDFDTEIKTETPRDNTFDRILGEREGQSFNKSINKMTYGNHKRIENNHFINKISIKDKIFEDFFKTYIPSNKSTKNNNNIDKLDIKGISIRSLRKTNTSNFVSRDGIENSYGFNSIINNTQVGGFVDRFLPIYKKKENSYWANRFEKGSLYSSKN